MAAGLQCFDENGVEVFNSEVTTLRFIGVLTTIVQSTSGSISDSRITPRSVLVGYSTSQIDGIFIPLIITAGDGIAYYFCDTPNIQISIDIYAF